MTARTIRALLKFFFYSVGWPAMIQEDDSVLVRDNHGGAWRVTVEKMP